MNVVQVRVCEDLRLVEVDAKVPITRESVTIKDVYHCNAQTQGYRMILTVAHEDAAFVHVAGVFRFNPVKFFPAVKILVDCPRSEFMEAGCLFSTPNLAMDLRMSLKKSSNPGFAGWRID